ncbi:polymorphic toxin-type HINT domain-containing protein [Propionibacteriaceae bacterium Y1685]
MTGPLRASWTYDTVKKGHLTSSSRHLGGKAITTTITQRDTAGRPTWSETSVPAITGWIEASLAKTYPQAMEYYPNGQEKIVAFPTMGNLNGEEIRLSYNTIGKPDALGGNGSYVGDAIYSGLGDLQQIATGSVSAKTQWATWEHDEATSRITRLQLDRASVPKADYDITYSWQPAGPLSKQSVTHPQSGAAADHQCFTTDYLQRLTRAWTPANGNCATTPTVAGLGGPAAYWLEWTYDKAGNRTKQVSHATAGDTTTTWTVPAATATRPHAPTQMAVTEPGKTAVSTGYGYDAAGNTTQRTSTIGAVPGAIKAASTLTYNPEDRLEKAVQGATTITYADDADGGRLIRRDNTTTTLYLGGTELTLSRSSNVVTGTRHYDFAGMSIAVRTGNTAGDVVTNWSDLNDTTSWQVNHNTGAISTTRSLPFGGQRGPVSGMKGLHGFVDGLNDATLGLVRVGARDYDPATGRFLTPDPVIDTAAPQQWNAYAYGNNNAPSFPDPTGELYLPSPGQQIRDQQREYTRKPKAPKKSTSGGAPSREPKPHYVASPPVPASPLRKSYGFFNNIFLGSQKASFDMVMGMTTGSVVDIAMRLALGRGSAEYANELYEKILPQDVTARESGEYKVSYVTSTVVQTVALMFVPGGGAAAAGSRAASVAPRVAGVAPKIAPKVAQAAKKVGQVLQKCGARSFAGATLVLMADGTHKPISQIEAGDMVWAADPETGQEGAQKVEVVWVHLDELIDLALADGTTITTTEDHPFWNDTDGAYQDAQDLDPGDQVLTANGDTLPVAGLRIATRHTDYAYNLTVTNIHTYHVSPDEILVHNCPPNAPKGKSPDGVPRDLPEQLALGIAKRGHGERIMGKMGDKPRLDAHYGEGDWQKIEFVLRGASGRKVTVHYFRNADTGRSVEFKFKRSLG